MQLSQADCVYYSKNAATNERGIPYAPFVERVEDYVTTRADVEKTLQSFQEMISWVLPISFAKLETCSSGGD